MTDLPPPAVPIDQAGVGDPENDVEPLRCTECGETLEYSGRGRKPTKCDKHKGSASRSGSSAPRQTAWPKASTVESALRMYLGMLGAGVAFIDPFDGRCIAKGKDDVAKELVNVARSHKDFRKVLEAISTPGEYAPLMAALMPVLVPIMAHHNMLPQFVVPMVVSDPDLTPPVVPAGNRGEGGA